MDQVKYISSIDWSKDWETPASLFTLCLTVPLYFEHIQKYFGYSFRNIIIDHVNGVSGCYYSDQDNDQFGKILKKQFDLDNQFVSRLTFEYRKNVDKINKLYQIKPTIFPKEYMFNKLYDQLNVTGSYRVSIKILAGCLNTTKDERYKSELESARKYGEHIYFELINIVQNILMPISKKSGYSLRAITSATLDEVQDFIRDGFLPNEDELLKRYEHCGILYSPKMQIFSGQKMDAVLSNFQKRYFKNNTLYGNVGYGGVVQGRCRVIKNFRTEIVFQEGEILVTGMTDPGFLSIMQKSSAVITDAGGVLCHAAIVAREMKKPCIIGTKIATQVLKDGDLVEVYAEKGIVQILKKSTETHS